MVTSIPPSHSDSDQKVGPSLVLSLLVQVHTLSGIAVVEY